MGRTTAGWPLLSWAADEGPSEKKAKKNHPRDGSPTILFLLILPKRDAKNVTEAEKKTGYNTRPALPAMISSQNKYVANYDYAYSVCCLL